MAKGIALHIGLNSVDPKRYEGWSGPLNACEADANDMADLAQSRGSGDAGRGAAPARGLYKKSQNDPMQSRKPRRAGAALRPGTKH